jgi:hypothetical protein
MNRMMVVKFELCHEAKIKGSLTCKLWIARKQPSFLNGAKAHHSWLMIAHHISRRRGYVG